MNIEQLEAAWDEQKPECRSCGWHPAFFEISEDFEMLMDECTLSHDCYWTHCVSKDSEDSYNHRGHYLYIPKKYIGDKD